MNRQLKRFDLPERSRISCCGNCVHCDFFAYKDENGEYQAYYDCELEHSCFDYNNGFCEDFERYFERRK